MAELSDQLRNATFYGILDTGYVARENIFEKCRQLLASGAKIVQLRAKKESEAEKRELALEILPYFIINDSPELAAEICRLIPNAGLHVGQDDMPPREARKLIGKNRVLGLSTHSPEQADAADELRGILDYFAVGPVYATNTKLGRKPVGLGLVEYVAGKKPFLPWFAIGGVNKKTARAVRSAGAERIVAVSDVLVAPDTEIAVKELVAEFLGP